MQNECVKEPKVGVVIIVKKGGKILLGKRKNCTEAGRWSFPGGHLEYGESPEECAKRELLEETGIKATRVSVGPWTNNMMENKHYIMLFMIIDEFFGEPQLKEPDKCEGWLWFDPSSLPKPLFSPIVSLLKENRMTTLFVSKEP